MRDQNARINLKMLMLTVFFFLSLFSNVFSFLLFLFFFFVLSCPSWLYPNDHIPTPPPFKTLWFLIEFNIVLSLTVTPRAHAASPLARSLSHGSALPGKSLAALA